MQAEFWHDRWRAGQIGFHRSHVDEHLQRHWPDLGLDPGTAGTSRVFVPLCGKSLDLLWLRDHGHSVVGVELSALALEAFCMENGVPARRRVLRDFELYQAPDLDLYCGDFYAMTPAQLGDLAGVFDRAALIAWPKEQRAPYALRMSELTQPGCEMLLVTLEYSQAQMTGPPFAVLTQEIMELYADRFRIRELARDDILSSEPRMRGRGLTALHEVCYRLTRL